MRTALRATITTAMAAIAALAGNISPAHAHNWDSLPDETITHHVFASMGSKELWDACNLNHRMRRLCMNPIVWKRHLPFFDGSHLKSLASLAHQADEFANQRGREPVSTQLLASIAAYRDRPVATVVGTGKIGDDGDNGPAAQASLHSPAGIAIDADGNLYISDSFNHRIRLIDAETGVITTIAGSTWGYKGDNGPAINARLHHPAGIAIDADGNLYIADSFNNRIRRVDAKGTITTIAGSDIDIWGYTGDGGPATNARLDRPDGIAIDADGNLYIADSFNHRIRRVDAKGTITTIAGTGLQAYSGDNGPAAQASLYYPTGIAIDAAGNLYITDSYNNRVRHIDATTGTITTIAGNGQRDHTGDNGPATQATFDSPRGIAIDAPGNLYITDWFNQRIRRIDATTGTITTIAGNGLQGYGDDGGSPTATKFHYPGTIAVHPDGYIYVTDPGYSRVRRFGLGSVESGPTRAIM